jgi:phosphatidylinositol-bisphosphatase
MSVADLNYRVDIADHDLRRILRDGEWDQVDKLEALFRFDQVEVVLFQEERHGPHDL